MDLSKPRRLFGTSGIRGIPGRDLTLEFVTEISQAVGTYLGRGPILIGYDGRMSSPTLARAVGAGLMSVGLDVAEGGLLPTPALQYGVRTLGYRGGVMVTASHNPPEYNGVKVSGGDGIDLSREEEVKMEEIYYFKKFRLADWRSVGSSIQEVKALPTYIRGVVSQVDGEAIRRRGFRVVADVGNGAQAVAAPYILEELNCRPVSLNGQVDGGFPGRGAEPTPETLKDLSEAVTAMGADMGVGYDGDGDRSLFCDEKGVVHWGDRSAALLVGYVLSKHPGGLIVTTVSASQVVDEIVEKRGGRIFKTRVGSVDVSNAMVELGAIFGLEENGGCFYGPHIPVRDGAMTTAMLLEAMAVSSRPLSGLLGDLPTYYQKKSKFKCSSERVGEVMSKVEAYAEGRVEKIDGVKVWVDEKSWILLRPSGTEPLIRVFAESDSQSRLDEMIREYSEVVKDALKSASRTLG